MPKARKTPNTPAAMLAEQWGHRLRAARVGKFPTQEAFAAALNRDQTWVSRYETGQALWTLEVMLLFAAVLGVAPGDLFEWPYGIALIEAHRLGIAS